MNGFYFPTRKVMTSFAFAIAAVATQLSPALADPNHEFVVNGGFEQATRDSGQIGTVTLVTGWNSTLKGDLSKLSADRYAFLGDAQEFTTTGVLGRKGGQLILWGPGKGADNGFASSSNGGNFIAADGAWYQGAISQLVTGLIVGQTYSVSFEWAAAQQYGFDGAPTAGWSYGVTSDPTKAKKGTYGATPIVTVPEHGFINWTSETFDFVADSTSSYLYFIAEGAPTGQPPFSLLDNVSLTGPQVAAVPEPGTWAMMIIGFGAVGGVMRRQARARRLAV